MVKSYGHLHKHYILPVWFQRSVQQATFPRISAIGNERKETYTLQINSNLCFTYSFHFQTVISRQGYINANFCYRSTSIHSNTILSVLSEMLGAGGRIMDLSRRKRFPSSEYEVYCLLGWILGFQTEQCKPYFNSLAALPSALLYRFWDMVNLLVFGGNFAALFRHPKYQNFSFIFYDRKPISLLYEIRGIFMQRINSFMLMYLSRWVAWNNLFIL